MYSNSDLSPALLTPLRLHFFPLELNSVFSLHDYVSVLLLLSCNASSMRSDCQGQGFTSQSQGHLGQSLCEVLQNKRIRLSTVW